MPRKEEIKKLIIEHQRRLQKLKEQEARRGIDTPPHILTEIEDIEVELERLEAELQTPETNGLDKEPPGQRLEPVKNPKRFHNTLWIATGAGLIILLGLVFIVLRPKEVGVPIPTLPPSPTLFTAIPTFTPEQFGILIADFCEGLPEPECISSEKGRELAKVIEDDLNKRLGQLPSLAERVKVQRVGKVAAPEEAGRIGLQQQATLIIWGWILSTEDNAIATRFIPINPVINTSADNVGGLVNALWIDANITGTGTFQVGAQVALRASALAEFITGFLFLLDNDWSNAVHEFSQAIVLMDQSLKAVPSDSPLFDDLERGLAALYLFRGIALAAWSHDSLYTPYYPYDRSDDDPRQDFDRAIELNPNLAVAYVNLGNLEFVRGDLDSAATHYQQAERINQKVASTYIGLGNVAFQRKEYDDALDYYKRALDLAGDKGREAIQARYLYGLTYMAQKEYAGATAQFERILAMENSPDDLRYLAERRLAEIRDPGTAPILDVITPIATIPAQVESLTPEPTLPRP